MMQLPVIPPFDFQHTLNFVQHFKPMGGEQTTASHSLTKALRLNGQTMAFRVESAGSVEAPDVRCTLFAESPLNAEIQQAIYDRAAFFLSLSDDLRPFYALADTDPAFQPVIKLLYGYHQVKFPSAFENACWAVLTARNRMAVARQMKGRIMELCGSNIEVDGVAYPAFPEPADVLSTDPAALTRIIGTAMRRTEYILSVAQAFATVDEEWLRTGDYNEVRRWLRSIKGIGEWASGFILIRALGRMERLTAPESNLIEAASRWYGRPMNADDVIQTAQHYGPYQAYWAHYIRAAS